MLYWHAVMNSCAVMAKLASPSTSMTVASGRPSCAPIAAGKPNPIVPDPPLVTKLRGNFMMSKVRRGLNKLRSRK